MLQKLILAAIMTFALNLLFGIQSPIRTQNAFSTKVNLAQVLKDQPMGLASVSNEK